ncbi:hypothetical protein GCM10023235_77670 [Kitasatospora terrestris]|uniref:Uncharacterized protein n=1 Tax=Kitasatospora terrestris TaxID=258051 RepID=A0ABP9EXK8_9ACTN
MLADPCLDQADRAAGPQDLDRDLERVQGQHPEDVQAEPRRLQPVRPDRPFDLVDEQARHRRDVLLGRRPPAGGVLGGQEVAGRGEAAVVGAGGSGHRILGFRGPGALARP